MKIPDFQELWRAVNRIQIDNIAKIEIEIEIEEFENEGLSTDLGDVYSTDKGELFTILKDGTIRKIIVHICDISNYSEIYNSLPKFHIFECTRLKEMREQGRGHRYKKASKVDGNFWIIKRNERGYEKLNICGYCLTEYKKIYDSQAPTDTFNIKNYMEKPMLHQQPYITDEQDMTTIPSSYKKNWNIISSKRKEYYKWFCQECFYNCNSSQLQKYLHTHHIDADRANNKHENLKVLCIECHAKQFQHGHIKETPKYKQFLHLKENHAS